VKFLSCLLSTGVLLSMTASAQQADVEAVIEGCRACHRGELALDGKTAAELLVSMGSIADGSVPHVVPMPPLSGADMNALAAALAGDSD
jgi:cytochrome c553